MVNRKSEFVLKIIIADFLASTKKRLIKVRCETIKYKNTLGLLITLSNEFKMLFAIFLQIS